MISEILVDEAAIILAATNAFIELGQQASERILNGKTSGKQDDKAEQILQMLTAYRRRDSLSDDNLESILSALKQLSGANSFPTVDPIVGQPINYRVTGINTGDSGGGSVVTTGRPTFDAYNPGSGNPPSVGSGDANAIVKGDQFYATTGSSAYGDLIGTVFGLDIHHGCVFTAKIAGAANNRVQWYLSEYGE